MSWDPSVGTFQSTLPPLFPLVSPSTFASSGARTEIDPKFPLLGVLSTAVFSAAQTAAIGAYNSLTVAPTKSISIAGGTVIASFLGSDLAQPYGVVPVGLAANMPVGPNQSFPIVGAPMPDMIDTSVYVIFAVPSNIAVSTLTVKMGLCLDPIAGNADITGSIACFGAAANPLISGKSTIDNSDLPLDVPTVTSALPATAGAFCSFSMLANTTSVVTGAMHLLRVTRKAGTSALDTHSGRLLLVSLDVIAS